MGSWMSNSLVAGTFKDLMVEVRRERERGFEGSRGLLFRGLVELRVLYLVGGGGRWI